MKFPNLGPTFLSRNLFSKTQTRRLMPYLASLVVVVVITVFGMLVRSFLDPTNIAMFYLLTVVFSATSWGMGPSVFSSVVAVLTFDVLFVPPYGTLAVHDPQYFLTFGVFLVVAVIISELGARIRSQVTIARQRQRQTEALYELTRGTAYVMDIKKILDIAAKQVSRVFGAEAIILLSSPEKELQVPQGTPLADLSWRAASWAFHNGQPAGFSTPSFPDADHLFLPLRTAQDTWGVLGLRCRAPGFVLEFDQPQLLEAFAGQLAIALEHFKLSAQVEQARLLEESERFRNALLSSISHDLRTPLSAIIGSISSLLDERAELSVSARHDLLLTVEEEASRLNRMVGNLLNMTRLESGALKPECDWHSIEEVIGDALSHLRANRHDVHVHLAPDLPLVSFDFVLIEQVLLNLLDNALKFSSPDSPIEIMAHFDGEFLQVSVEDRGIGIPPDESEHVFERFYRGRQSHVRGTGLGLSICKGIVEAHRGAIRAESRFKGGTRMTFTIPATGHEKNG